MNFLRRLFGGPAAGPSGSHPSEHAVLVYIPLSNDEFGEARERDAIHELTGTLDACIREAKAGEFDGDEFGGGECTLFMYGPDADALFSAIEAPLRASPLVRGGHAILRYGSASDPDAREVRVELGE
jgi:hypothetical protein